MELRKGHIAFWAACLIAGIVLGASFRSCSSKPAEPALRPEVIHDTVTVHDTMRIKEHTRLKEVLRHDTIWLLDTTSKTTSSTTKDTTSKDADFALVPITQSEYRDTFKTDSSRIELGVQFSGYHAKIESVDIDYNFTIPAKIVTKKQRFTWSLSFGLQGGYGATFGKDGIIEMRPYAGVGGTLGASINF